MQSTATPVESLTQTRASLVERVGIGLALALVLNGIVRLAAGALLDIGGIQPLAWVPIVSATVVAALGATVAYVVVSRLSTRPDRHFTILAAVVLLLSMAPVFTVASALEGVTMAILVVLALLHATTAVGIVAGLTGVAHR